MQSTPTGIIRLDVYSGAGMSGGPIYMGPTGDCDELATPDAAWVTYKEDLALGFTLPFEASLADGQILSSGTVQIYAVRLDVDDIYVYTPASDVPADVTGEYYAAVKEYLSPPPKAANCESCLRVHPIAGANS